MHVCVSLSPCLSSPLFASVPHCSVFVCVCVHVHACVCGEPMFGIMILGTESQAWAILCIQLYARMALPHGYTHTYKRSLLDESKP